MTRFLPVRSFVLSALILASGLCLAEDTPIRVGGAPRELTIHSIGERTLRIGLAPLDGDGKPVPSPATAVFVPCESVERLRVRDLPAARTIDAGAIRVAIKPQPLTIAVTRAADGRVVQALSFDAGDGSIVFRTEAPVFGLGEGRQQFDRRGFYYDFINGQGQLLATHGATAPVPFLLGVDGWAMFIHNPPVTDADLTGPAATRDANIPWGTFDLRGGNAGPPPPRPTRGVPPNLTPPAVMPTRGKFRPRPDTVARTPVEIFVINLDKPTDAMAEYVRLTGHPAMPPKWVMGYMQSHRSLAGPDRKSVV